MKYVVATKLLDIEVKVPKMLKIVGQLKKVVKTEEICIGLVR